MEFRNLLSFMRIVELGSITKAAEELGYAQSTVTSQIQQLENELGQPLFERIGKRIFLTEYGKQILPYARQIIHIQSEMMEVNRTDPKEIHGTIRIGIVESIMSSLLLSIIREYRKKFPHVSICFRIDITKNLFELLRHNEVDVIFTMGEKMEIEDCVCASSHLENAVFIASKENPLSRETSIPLPEIFRQKIILIGEGAFLQRELYKMADSCHREIQSDLETQSSRMILDLVRQNLGIAFLPEYLIRSDYADREKVVQLPVTGFTSAFFINIYYHRNKYLTRQIRGLIDMVDIYWQS